jgi:predicted dehydrogenase
MNPAALRARDLIACGAIGRPLSERIYSSTIGFGLKIPTAESYSEKAENGVTLVTIQGGHTLDLSIPVLGRLVDVTALATTQSMT